MVLEWLEARATASGAAAGDGPPEEPRRQGLLWTLAPYQEDAPAITSQEELSSAIEHLHYAVFRRYNNQSTRAERARLDNTIANAMFKIDRYLSRIPAPASARFQAELGALRAALRDAREQAERRKQQARRAELKLAELASLSPESFEEFVAELFEMLDFEVERSGGSGDEGADLRLHGRDGLEAVVQCKYHKQGVVGSPAIQRFLGTIHHLRCHKGFFVTTSTFSLSALKFAAENPIELVDGPRLVELIEDAIGPQPRRAPDPAGFPDAENWPSQT
jgi:restriction system protein